MLEHGSPLWDDVRTKGRVETRDDILARVATGLPAEPWGARHTVRFAPLLPHFALTLGLDESVPPKAEPAFARGGGIETVDKAWPEMQGENFAFRNGTTRRITLELTPEGPVAYDALPTRKTAEL